VAARLVDMERHCENLLLGGEIGRHLQFLRLGESAASMGRGRQRLRGQTLALLQALPGARDTWCLSVTGRRAGATGRCRATIGGDRPKVFDA
jgi:hypothetical protein